MITPRVEDFIDSLQPIAAEISIQAAWNLCKLFGGTRLYVPKVWRQDAEVNAIGEADAIKLCALFGPERIDIPRMGFTTRAQVKFMDAMRRDGHSNAAIAREIGLSWRTVARLAHAPAHSLLLTKKRGRVSDSRQVDLVEWLDAQKR